VEGQMALKKSLFWVGLWIGLAIIFDIGIYFFMGHTKALQFLAGYVIELSLSVDNLFVFLLIFESFCIHPNYRVRALNYGIGGAIVLRFLFIFFGVALVNKFHWILYIFGLLLIYSGAKMAFEKEKDQDFLDSLSMRILGKIIPIHRECKDHRFFVKEDEKRYATLLFAVLILINVFDIIFAIDSIPAIFSITTDLFIVYTSNIFAVLGLRNLYFLIEKMHEAFEYVKYGVALILVFIGVKLSILFFDIEIPILTSLLVIAGILVLSIILSVMVKERVIVMRVRRK
jgi:tellurite resistance protein TerC